MNKRQKRKRTALSLSFNTFVVDVVARFPIKYYLLVEGRKAAMNENTKNRKKKILWLLIFVAVNVLVVGWTAYKEFHVEDEPVRLTLGENGWGYLLLGFLCMAVLLLAESLKFLRTASCLQEQLSFRDAFETVVLGKYYDAITPTGGGGQPFQMYWLHKKGLSTRGASNVAAAGFITRQLAVILLAIATFLLWKGDLQIEAIRYAAYAGLFFNAIPPLVEIAFSIKPEVIKALLAWVFRLGEKLHLLKDAEATLNALIETLSQYHDGFFEIVKDKRLLFELMLLSFLCRIALCSIPFFVLQALGCETTYLHILATTIYIYAAVTLIPTPGNAGVSEGAFYLVFSEVGSSGIFWAMLIWRVICYYSLLLMGLIVLGKHTQRFIVKDKTSDEKIDPPG